MGLPNVLYPHLCLFAADGNSYFLFADTHGVHPDVCDWCHDATAKSLTMKDVPSSIAYWVQILEEAETASGISVREAASEAICQLVAESIGHIKHAKGGLSAKAVISAVVSQNSGMRTKFNVRTVMLLMNQLQCDATSKSTPKGTGTLDKEQQDLLDYAGGDLLLANFTSSDAVRECIRDEQGKEKDPFSNCSPKLVVPKLVFLVALHAAGSSSDDSTSVLMSLLTTSLVGSHIQGKDRTEAFAGAVIESLMDLVTEAGSREDSLARAAKAVKSKGALLEQTCTLIGQHWRRVLFSVESNALGSQSTGSSAFGSALAAVGGTMFKFPSSTVPLTLFGALVGDGDSYDRESGADHLGNVISNAAAKLIGVVVSELDSLVSEGEKADPNDSSGGIFRRLAPLLLLRRAPPRLFQEAYQEMMESNALLHAEMRQSLRRLANHLAMRLDIGDASASPRSAYSTEERQMAAEVAGRCLPFNVGPRFASPEDDDLIFSCFQRICQPGFASLHDLLLEKTRRHDEDSRSKIRRARAALYATCHFVPFCTTLANEPVEEALVSTSFFCLHVLNARQELFEASDLDEDFLKLQTGCIEFFALCSEQYLLQSSPSHGQPAQCKAPESIFKVVVQITQTGVCATTEPKPWATKSTGKMIPSSPTSVGNDMLLTGADNTESAKTLCCSVACITCLWNSLIVIAQRCPDRGGKVESLSTTILPRLIRWGGGMGQKPNGSLGSHRNPLCVTAALQLAFILVTRSKSFGDKGESNARALQQWAFCAIKEGKKSSDLARAGLRSAGLKALLSVITIVQMSGRPLSQVFNRDDIGEMLPLLNDMARNDGDTRVETLAGHVVGALLA